MSTSKPKQTKSRNGCATCKAKRLKCDETKPDCVNCQKRNLICGGYKKDLRWRAFEEGAYTHKTSIRAQKSLTPLAPTSAPMDSCQRRSVAEHLAGDMCARRHSGAHSEGAGSLLLEQSDRDSLQLSTQSTSLPLSFTDTSPDAGWVTTLANRFDLSTSIDAASLMARYDVFSTASSNTSILYALNALTPDLLDLENENENEQVSLTGSAEQNSYMTDLDICGLTDTLSHGTLADQARCKDPYQDMLSVNWDRGSKPFNLPSPALSRQSPSADSSVGSDGLESFGIPVPAAESEPLISNFGRTSTHRIPSWSDCLQLLKGTSSAVLHATEALVCFNDCKQYRNLQYDGIKSMQLAISSMKSSHQNQSPETTIATTIILAFLESWSQHMRTSIGHISQATLFLKKTFMSRSQGAINGNAINAIVYLGHSCLFMSLFANVTSSTEKYFSATDAEELGLMLQAYEHYQQWDLILGCPLSLVPLISQVSHFNRMAQSETKQLSILIPEAIRLRTALDTWECPQYVTGSITSDARRSFTVQMGEVYRLTALLHLHQGMTVAVEPKLATVAIKIVQKVSLLPVDVGHIMLQIYPLLVAGGELSAFEERGLVVDRLTALADRTGFSVVCRCLEVVKEVWRRRDGSRLADSLSGGTSRYVRIPTPIPLYDPSMLLSTTGLGVVAEPALTLPPNQLESSVPCSSVDHGQLLRANPLQYPASGLAALGTVPISGFLEHDPKTLKAYSWMHVLREWEWEGWCILPWL